MLVRFNASRRRVGESHPKAKLTDGEVELIRELWRQGIGPKRIGEKMECSVNTVKSIISFRRRNQTAESVEEVD